MTFTFYGIYCGNKVLKQHSDTLPSYVHGAKTGDFMVETDFFFFFAPIPNTVFFVPTLK